MNIKITVYGGEGEYNEAPPKIAGVKPPSPPPLIKRPCTICRGSHFIRPYFLRTAATCPDCKGKGWHYYERVGPRGLLAPFRGKGLGFSIAAIPSLLLGLLGTTFARELVELVYAVGSGLAGLTPR